MDQKINELTINGETYVLKSEANVVGKEKDVKGMRYVMVRTQSAGVHCGYLKSQEGQIVTLLKARRMWYWDGAASLSQLAMEGTKAPDKCQFPCIVDEITLLQAIEIIPMTAAAIKSIGGVKIWQR